MLPDRRTGNPSALNATLSILPYSHPYGFVRTILQQLHHSRQLRQVRWSKSTDVGTLEHSFTGHDTTSEFSRFDTPERRSARDPYAFKRTLVYRGPCPHDCEVTGLVFSPNGRYLAALVTDESVRGENGDDTEVDLWDTGTGEQKYRLPSAASSTEPAPRIAIASPKPLE